MRKSDPESSAQTVAGDDQIASDLKKKSTVAFFFWSQNSAALNDCLFRLLLGWVVSTLREQVPAFPDNELSVPP